MSRWPDQHQPASCATCACLILRKHCDSPTCNWWICDDCKSYGNTKRWAQASR